VTLNDCDEPNTDVWELCFAVTTHVTVTHHIHVHTVSSPFVMMVHLTMVHLTTRLYEFQSFLCYKEHSTHFLRFEFSKLNADRIFIIATVLDTDCVFYREMVLL